MPALPPFRDRTDAGQQLAAHLQAYAYRPDVLVLGLPRGGVPVAFVVATTLHVPMDLLLVRKLGAPGAEELALGAIASGGSGDPVLARVLNTDLVHALRISDAAIRQVVRREEQELERRARAYRGDQPFPPLAGRTILLVDDGIATGATMQAALAVVRPQQPACVVVAAPVAHRATCAELRRAADEVVCVLEPDPLWAVALWYQEFPQTSDDEIRRLLGRMRARAWRFHVFDPAMWHAADAQTSGHAAPIVVGEPDVPAHPS
jgi:putative phosphoribosyl transferase